MKEKTTITTKTKSNPYKEPDSLKAKIKKIKPELLHTRMNKTSVLHVAEIFALAKGYSCFPPICQQQLRIEKAIETQVTYLTRYSFVLPLYFLAICNTIFACNYKLLGKN